MGIGGFLEMDKKVIALILLAVVIVGGYASYYAYATIVIIPEDLKTLKEELDAASTPFINESSIEDLEYYANVIESYDALSLMSQSERDVLAQNLTRSTSGASIEELNRIKQNFTENRDRAQKYDYLFKSDVANDIRMAYSDELFDLVDQLIALNNKMATDIKNGDSQAFANDMREMAKLGRELNNYQEQIKIHLQDAVTKLGG